MQESFQVLVACSANVCRSPLAAIVMRNSLASLGPDVHVSWAGTYAMPGDAMCPQAASYLGLSGMVGDSRQLTDGLVDRSDLLLTADRSQRAWIARRDPASRPRTFTIRQGARLAAWVAAFVTDGSRPYGAAPLPAGTLARLQWLAVEMDAARGMLAAWDPRHDDIEDLHGEEDHREILDEVAQASRQLADALTIVAMAPDELAEAGADSPEPGSDAASASSTASTYARVKDRIIGRATIDSQPELNEALQAENLGHIHSASATLSEVIMTRHPEIEQHLKRALGHAALDQGKAFPAAILVTSPTAASGKTATAISLASSYAQSGASVVFVDADLHGIKVGAYLGIESEIGLPEVLAGLLSLEQAELIWHRGLLHVLARGPRVSDAHSLLNSAQMQVLIAELRTRFDLVVINGTPLEHDTDSAALAALADGAVLVVGAGVSTKKQIEHAAVSLVEGGAKLLGTIMTFRPTGHEHADR